MTDAISHGATDLRRVLPSLYVLEDTCNAYAVVDGDAALVVDPGSGRIAAELAAAGVDAVEWALHTHHHRDQCWGTSALVERGADVAVPEHERHLFDDVETFWAKKRLYDNYNDRNTVFALGESVPVTATLDDYETFSWRDYRFDVVPAKGHTFGSSALVAEIDGRTVAFSGDLLRAGGHLHQLHAMEYGYSDMKGVPFTIQSIRALRDRDPELLLPSHGEPIDDPAGDIDRLQRRLMALVDLGPHGDPAYEDLGVGRRAYLPEMRMVQVSEHLLWGGPWTCSNFYVIVSDSGKALFVDYGHSLREHMMIGRDRDDMETMRFVEHHLDELVEDHGVTEFDVVIPTHIHDDHTCGIPHLQRHYDVECWALDAVGQVLDDPAAWSSSPCVYPEPIEIHRWFEDGDRFEWEEFTFDIYHAPGQTEYHSLVAAEIDGRTVAFSGDNYFEAHTEVHPDRTERRPHQTTVLRNSFQFEMHRRCKDVMRAVMPEVVCPGHGEVLEVDPAKIATYCDYVDRKEAAFRAAVGDDADQRVDLFWARLLPYHSEADPGETVEFSLRLRNNFDGERTYRARLLAPDGRTELESGTLTLAPDARGELSLPATVDDGWGTGRQLVTAAVAVDGDSKGPVVEAVVEVA